MEILFHRKGQGESVVQLGPYELEPLIPRDQEGAMTCYRVRIAPFSRTGYKLARQGRGDLLCAGRSRRGRAESPSLSSASGRFSPASPQAPCTPLSREAEPLELLDIHSPGSWPDRDLYFAEEGSTSA